MSCSIHPGSSLGFSKERTGDLNRNDGSMSQQGKGEGGEGEGGRGGKGGIPMEGKEVEEEQMEWRAGGEATKTSLVQMKRGHTALGDEEPQTHFNAKGDGALRKAQRPLQKDGWLLMRERDKL